MMVVMWTSISFLLTPAEGKGINEKRKIKGDDEPRMDPFLISKNSKLDSKWNPLTSVRNGMLFSCSLFQFSAWLCLDRPPRARYGTTIQGN